MDDQNTDVLVVNEANASEGGETKDAIVPVGSSQPMDREALEQALTVLSSAPSWINSSMESIDWDKLPEPPSSVTRFLAQFSRPASSVQRERRRIQRTEFVETVVAVQLNENHKPVGDPFKLTARDITIHAIGLIHTEPIDTPFLAISWRGAQGDRTISIVVEIIRCRNVNGLYDICGVLLWDQSFWRNLRSDVSSELSETAKRAATNQ